MYVFLLIVQFMMQIKFNFYNFSILWRVSVTAWQRASGIGYAVVAGGCDWPSQ